MKGPMGQVSQQVTCLRTVRWLNGAGGSDATEELKERIVQKGKEWLVGSDGSEGSDS